jgi:hypothetical protein
MENLLCFWCLENLLVPHIERLHTSKLIVNSPLLVLNISLQNCEVLLVVRFPTKFVSSHSEFPCKSYLSFIVPGMGSPVWPQAGSHAEPSGPRPDFSSAQRTYILIDFSARRQTGRRTV